MHEPSLPKRGETCCVHYWRMGRSLGFAETWALHVQYMQWQLQAITK